MFCQARHGKDSSDYCLPILIFFAFVSVDMILQEEFTTIPGLFIRKVTFRVPPGQFDELICFVETYSPRMGFVKPTPLIVYRK